MNAKVITYLLYLATTVPLTVFVARTLYRNGRMFLHDVFRNNEPLADAVNHLLVVGFYLLNLGFVAMFLKTTQAVDNGEQIIEVLSRRVGFVAIVLGVVHLVNVWVFNGFRNRAIEADLRSAPVATSERVGAWGAPQ